MILNKISFLLFAILFITSCGLFETRVPEEPGSDNGDFVPPTSADIVIENLLTAFNTKNVNNYCDCFFDSLYNFIPSSDANLNYPGLFNIWKVADERNYFLNLINILGQSNKMELILTNIKYDSQSSDSVVLLADYNVTLELSDAPNTKYVGLISLTIVPNNNGIWRISRWLDFQIENEINKTFSELKARFHS